MTQWIRNYEVLRELGSGHFGQVHLAIGEVPARGLHPARRRVVAIKKLRDHADPESLRLLLQEFSLLDQVKHRGIVRVFDYLEEERAVVMEYVHGVTLRTVLDDCIKSREQVFTEAAIEIGCEIADALYQAWTTPGDNGEKLQLVHRDLKPENIMLTTTGEVKILDFGLARVDNADFAKEDPDLIRGTPVYMAPEQARGGEIDHRTDLFALGLILYELLASRAAYRVPTDALDPVARVYAAIENGEVGEAVRELEQKLPGTGPIVARLLQVRPRNRYGTGQDLLVDLRRQLYKDRGAYLKEFCGFYFGGIHPLPDPPDAEAPQGGRMSSEKRTSIEERLARASAEGVESSPVTPKGAVPVRRVPRVAPSAAPPPPEPLAAPRAPAAPLKITQRPAPTGRTEPELEDIVPPSVKGAKPAPKAPSGPPPRSSIGARSPQEAGMLPMTPLSLNDDEKEANADPSATSFFAIPAPKAERPKSAAPPVAPPPGGPTPMASSGGGGSPGPYMPPSPGAPIAVAAAPAAATPSIIYSNNPAGTPFNAVGPTPTQGGADESRMQSVRVYVLVLAAFAILCVGTVAAVLLIYFFSQAPKTDAPPQVATNTEAPPPPVVEEPSEPPAVAAQPAKTPSTKKVVKNDTPSTPAAPAEPKSGNGTVSVRVSGASPTSVEVSCASGFRARAGVSGGSASVAGVPVADDCKLYLKGGVVATPARVKGGKSYSCTVTGTTMQCS